MSRGKPDLTGRLVPASEVARIIGKTRQRVDQLVGTPGFPVPAVEIPPRIRLWWRDEVEDWARRNRS